MSSDNDTQYLLPVLDVESGVWTTMRVTRGGVLELVDFSAEITHQEAVEAIERRAHRLRQGWEP